MSLRAEQDRVCLLFLVLRGTETEDADETIESMVFGEIGVSEGEGAEDTMCISIDEITIRRPASGREEGACLSVAFGGLFILHVTSGGYDARMIFSARCRSVRMRDAET